MSDDAIALQLDKQNTLLSINKQNIHKEKMSQTAIFKLGEIQAD